MSSVGGLSFIMYMRTRCRLKKRKTGQLLSPTLGVANTANVAAMMQHEKLSKQGLMFVFLCRDKNVFCNKWCSFWNAQ